MTMSDPRVKHFWDGERQVGEWFAEHVEGYIGVSWDTYFLYGPDAKWEMVPSSLVGSGGTTYDQRATLRSQVGELIGK